MKVKILIIALMAFSAYGFSQEIGTIFSDGGSKSASFGGYGGPLAEVLNINNDWGVVMGGKGGVVINRNFAVGGIGKVLVSSIDFIGDDLIDNENSALTLSYAVGGIFAEYLIDLESPVHFSIPVNFMGGGVTVKDGNSEDIEIESSGIFVIEPGISLEFNVSKTFIPAVNLSYRQVLGSSLVNMNEQDLSGLSFGLTLKFGSF